MKSTLPTIDSYLDYAKDALSVRSDRKLAKLIGVTPATVNAWRGKRQWPTEEAMIRLGDLLDIPAKVALMDLRRWASKSFEASEAYEDIYRESVQRIYEKEWAKQTGQDEVYVGNGISVSKDLIKTLSKIGVSFTVIAFLLVSILPASPAHAANLSGNSGISVYYGKLIIIQKGTLILY
ncbi:MAG: hypothetical protein CMM42_17540 [Rhodospirillaceae bacterium]|nr:hypothetical protein [Rhodospirillaceae bacterium]